MPKIENVTKIEVSNDITGSNFMKLYIFKENLIQLLLISENIWTNINNNKSQNNIYDLFEISFSETNLQLEVRSNVEFSNFNGISRNINKIFIQKSNYYENYEKGFVSFNVIGYNLGGIWYSMSNYYKNENYNYLTIISGFKGNIITKPDVKKILFKVKFISQQENQNITIENLIYISNKRHYFGYTNDTKNEISCFPLIRPFSYITASVKLENENNSQIIYFENDTSFTIPSVSLNEKILIKKISTITRRITDDIGENLLFDFSTFGANQTLYNISNTDSNTGSNYFYKLKINIISLKFTTNRNLSGLSSDQSDNKILINKYTNNISFVEEGSDFSNNLFSWGTQIPLITHHSYLEQKIVGITEELLNSNNFFYKDLNYKILIKNKNSSIIDIYIQNYSSLAIKKILQNTSEFGNVDLRNNILQVIPRAKNNMDGKKAFIGYKIIETNYSIFKNLIIPDTTVDIAGIQTNVEKVLINLDRNSGLDTTYSSKIFLSTINNTYYNNIKIEDAGQIFSLKNPYISTIKQILTLNYKVYINNNDIIFERLNNSDNSILDLSGSSSNSSNPNPEFTVLEDEIYYFDVSDESNKGKTIKFFLDQGCQSEFLDLSDNGFPYANYSRNYEPGEEGAYIQIITPEKNNEKIINSTFYYALLKKNYFNNQTITGTVINILGRKTLYHGEISVENIDKGANSGLLTYSNETGKFYDPLSEKPRVNIDISYASIDTMSNYFNKYEYKDISGQLEISASNVKSFTGDNIVCFKDALSRYDYKFMLTNTNLIHGKIKVGFSTIYNSDLFTTIDPQNQEINSNENTDSNINNTASQSSERFLKNIPYDLSNVELNGIPNEKNDTNYVVYTTKNYNQTMNKTDFLIQYVPETTDKVYNQDVSFNRFSTGDLSDCSQNIFISGDIKNGNTYMALIIIKEDLFGISRFEKIINSDAINTSSILTSTDISNNYKSSDTSSTIPDISLNVGFVRKKFNFKSDISGISHNDNVFLFEPLDYSNNILNHDLNYNEYVVGMFDTSVNNFDKISMCRIKLKQTKPFFTNTVNSGIVVDNSVITSKWVSGDFGLYETKPRDLVLKYKNEFTDESKRRNDIILSNLKLPLFDSNTYNEFTVEIEYFKCWDNNPDSKITYRINRKDSGGNLTEYDTIATQVISRTNGNFKPHEEEFIAVDISGSIYIKNINSSIYYIGENLGGKSRKYKVSYQIENYLTNDILNEILTNKLYNFNALSSITQLGKTVLNMKYLNTPLTLPDDMLDISKNNFNDFLNETNPTGQILNTLINKQNSIKITNLLYQDTDISSAQLSYTGIGNIIYNTKEFINDSYDPSGAYSNLSGNQINFNVIDVKTITDLDNIILNEKNVKLSWNFINDNLSVVIKFNIYRSQNPSNKEYILIASTANKYYTDSGAIPYLTADYKVESVAVWDNVELTTGYKETKSFICENNTFEYGRYNNTTKNIKLYQPINKSCRKIGMRGFATTGNLFPNSQVLTKSEIYSTLSRAKFRPFR